MKALAFRWLKFNFVGAAGIVVQLACLWILTNGLQIPYLAATAVAVEVAILHNFVWHERFTWKDRKRAPGAWGLFRRLLLFHSGNGLISIAGNLVLMRLLVGTAHWKPLVANMVAIAVCSLANFIVSEWFVFRH